MHSAVTTSKMNHNSNSLDDNAPSSNEACPPQKKRKAALCRVAGCTNHKQSNTEGRCKSCHRQNLEPRVKKTCTGGPGQVQQNFEDNTSTLDSNVCQVHQASRNEGGVSDRGNSIGFEQEKRRDKDSHGGNGAESSNHISSIDTDRVHHHMTTNILPSAPELAKLESMIIELKNKNAGLEEELIQLKSGYDGLKCRIHNIDE